MTDVAPRTAQVDAIDLEDGETHEIEYDSKVVSADGTTAGYIVTPREWRKQSDATARRYMDISGDEFLRRGDAGEWHELYDEPGFGHIGHLVDIRPYDDPEA